MGIFKAYDIRGIYGTELTEGIFYKIARAYARFADVKGGKVVVEYTIGANQ
jgi:phosphomannomutase